MALWDTQPDGQYYHRCSRCGSDCLDCRDFQACLEQYMAKPDNLIQKLVRQLLPPAPSAIGRHVVLVQQLADNKIKITYSDNTIQEFTLAAPTAPPPAPCVATPARTIDLGNITIGQAYTTDIPLAGTAPIAISNASGVVSGLQATMASPSILRFAGTPNTSTSLGQKSATITVTNCGGPALVVLKYKLVPPSTTCNAITGCSIS